MKTMDSHSSNDDSLLENFTRKLHRKRKYLSGS